MPISQTCILANTFWSKGTLSGALWEGTPASECIKMSYQRSRFCRPPETTPYPCPAKWAQVRYDFGLKYAISDRDGHVDSKKSQKFQKIPKIIPSSHTFKRPEHVFQWPSLPVFWLWVLVTALQRFSASWGGFLLASSTKYGQNTLNFSARRSRAHLEYAILGQGSIIFGLKYAIKGQENRQNRDLKYAIPDKGWR